MRMRHKPYARPELAAWPQNINTPQANRASWRAAFKNPALPLRLEMGCGKGSFLAGIALAQPGYNYLGVDIKSEMLVVAKRTIQKQYAAAGKTEDNILICSYNIEKIGEIIAPEDQVERLYINFCNPWYKTGHAKHRLTHPRQLIQYRRFLQPGAAIYFKTDDGPLFEDTLRYFEMTGFEVTWLTRNLHQNEPEWNVRTEHENMFSAEGIAIKACIAQMRPAQLDEEKIAKSRTI